MAITTIDNIKSIADSSDESDVASDNRDISISNRTRPKLTIAVLIAADVLVLAAAMLIAIYSRWAVGGGYNPIDYLQLWPCLAIFVVAFAGSRLYPGIPYTAAQELHKLAKIITFVFLILGTATFFLRNSLAYSRSVLIISWLLSMPLVWMGRCMVRTLLAKYDWWGKAVLIIGGGKNAQQIVKTLLYKPEMGLKPVAVVTEYKQVESGSDRLSMSVEGFFHVPVVMGIHRYRKLVKDHHISCAVVAMPKDKDPDRINCLLNGLSRTLKNVIYIPDINGLSSLWVNARDMGGTLGLEVRHRLLDPGRQTLKRIMDLTAIVVFSPILVPMVALIALAIRLDSRGPVFYPSVRLGRGGVRFKAWKFRSMRFVCGRTLGEFLDEDPALREEWQASKKLCKDPRITRVGRFLRKTSLDELPQLYNVLIGQMSLVGPRPMLEDEPKRYGKIYPLYAKVTPGLTGPWQVAGRNDLPYEDRLRLTAYYVRNWSVWLDIYILAKTVPVVLFGKGAY